MKDCNAAALETAPLDPRKLPNYVFGMVLGPTDFRQVLEHFEWKHRNANLLLHGTGTVCGLEVSLRLVPGGTDVEVAVAAGHAISPRGRWINVPRDQCARLNQWLQAHKSDPYATPGPGRHRLYVTLCYDQCLVDLVPIAGQQCAPDSSNRAPSRILESFRLQFAWMPPTQPYEDRVRAFGDLLRRIEIDDELASLALPDDSEALIAAVRLLAQDPLPFPGSLPAGPFRLSAGTEAATMNRVLAMWATEVCPMLAGKPEVNPVVAPAKDDCLLLAAVDFTVRPDGQLDVAVDSLGNLLAGGIVVDQRQRPVLAPTRLLQEFALRGVDGGAMRSGTVRLAPTLPATWPQLGSLAAPLPADLAQDALIECTVERSTPALLTGGAVRNVALTVHRAPFGPPSVVATNLAGVDLNEVIVRWRSVVG